MLDKMLFQKTLSTPRERWEKKTENIHISMTPTMRKHLQYYLGDYPVSRWLAELIEKELENAAEHDRKLATTATATKDVNGE